MAAQRLQRALDWVREHSEPPDGVELRAADGSVYTGVAIIERNDIVILWAVRHPATIIERPAPPAPRSPMQRSLGMPSYPDPDSPYWDRDGDPFRR